MQYDEEARHPPWVAATIAQPCLPERGGGEPGYCCVPGCIVPSTTGRRAIVEVRPSSGYSDHLVSERKANAGVQANEA
jgi:hypothetical protein